MNLKQSLSLTQLQKPLPAAKQERISAIDLAERVFQIAAKAGEPYEGLTPKQWARKWLASSWFVLTKIEANSAAIPNASYNTNKVLANIKACAVQPIVVDLNKRRIGTAFGGFVPDVIVVDGKHRHMSEQMRGKELIDAWVGVKAVDYVNVKYGVSDVNAGADGKNSNKPLKKSWKIDAAMATAPGAITTNRPMPAQDVAQRSSAPNSPMPGVKSTGAPMKPFTKGQKPVVKAGGGGTGTSGTGGSTGATGGPGATDSGMNPNYMRAKKMKGSKLFPGLKKKVAASKPFPGLKSNGQDPSDRDGADPSDRNGDNDPSDRQQSPFYQSPGSGVGPRQPKSKGASNSDMQKILGQGKRVEEMFQRKRKEVEAVSPPGCENMVKGLKKSNVDNPWAVAWDAHNKGKCE